MKLRYVVLPLFAVFTLNGCYSLIGAAMASGFLAALALPSFEKARSDSRNSQVRSNARLLQLALESYAADNDGLYPTGLAWLAPTRELPAYVSGNKLLPLSKDGSTGPGLDTTSLRGKQVLARPYGNNPFGQPSQTEPIALSAGLAGPGQAPTAVNTVLGPGKLPGKEPYDARTYGALIWAISEDHKAYVVYGIGASRGQAVVVAAFTELR